MKVLMTTLVGLFLCGLSFSCRSNERVSQEAAVKDDMDDESGRGDFAGFDKDDEFWCNFGSNYQLSIAFFSMPGVSPKNGDYADVKGGDGKFTKPNLTKVEEVNINNLIPSKPNNHWGFENKAEKFSVLVPFKQESETFRSGFKHVNLQLKDKSGKINTFNDVICHMSKR